MLAIVWSCQASYAQTILTGDHLISGDLQIENELVVSGTAIDFGASGTAPVGTPGEAGILVIYSDPATTDGVATIEQRSMRQDAVWHWQSLNGSLVETKANLDQNNRLSLFAPSGTSASIILDPGTISGGASIEVGGQQVVLEGQTGIFLPASIPVSSGTGSVGSVVLGNYAGGVESWNPPTVATGSYSTAWGARNSATSYASTAWGIWNKATGDNSTTWGEVSEASGWASTAAGFGARANSFASFVVGRYNAFSEGASGGTWVGNDSLFEVGNGTEWDARSNALTLFKDATLRTAGVIEAKGGLRTPPQGDLSMGEFTAGENPADLDPALGLKYPPE